MPEARNPRYYRLLRALGRRVGLPFHKGERIVADEAVGGFVTAWLNTLVMEEWFTERLAAAQ